MSALPPIADVWAVNPSRHYGAALEALARTHTVLFDKTGTLTVGGARLIAVETAPGESADEVLRLAGSLAALAFHLLTSLPNAVRPWIAENLKNALIINVLLAIFNLLPLPPLDGGRILVGMLPEALATPLMQLEPYGLMLLIGLLFILPLLGAQLGIDLNIVWQLVQRASNVIINAILKLTGNNSL